MSLGVTHMHTHTYDNWWISHNKQKRGLLSLYSTYILFLHDVGSVSSDCSDRIIANKANVISSCMPSAPLLTTNPFLWPGHMTTEFHKPPSWKLGFTVSAVHRYSFMVCPLWQQFVNCTHTVRYLHGGCSGVGPYWTHKDRNMFPFLQVAIYLPFLLVMCTWSQVVGNNRQFWCCYWALFLNGWQLRRGWAAFRHHSLQRLSYRVDRLETETLTFQTS